MKIKQMVTATLLLVMANVAVADGHDNSVRHYLSLGTSLSATMSKYWSAT